MAVTVSAFWFFFFSSRRRHTRCALVTGVQTCALPISVRFAAWGLLDGGVAGGEAPQRDRQVDAFALARRDAALRPTAGLEGINRAIVQQQVGEEADAPPDIEGPGPDGPAIDAAQDDVDNRKGRGVGQRGAVLDEQG